MLNVSGTEEARLIVPVIGETIAIIGENRKMLVFPIKHEDREVPEMGRGKGVRLQKYKDGGVSDAKTFALSDGLTWTDSSGRTFTRSRAEIADWIGKISEAGRIAPNGFPRNNKFGG